MPFKIIIYFVKTFSIDHPVEWFVVMIIAYIAFGFGGCIYDTTFSRFRDKQSGQFVSAFTVALRGTSGDALTFIVFYAYLTEIDKVGFVLGTVFSILLTITIDTFRHR